MITAAQAKEKTKERIRTLAEEFVTNFVGMPIQNAIDKGKFFTKVTLAGKDIDGVDNKVLGSEVVKILEESGFKAEHVLIDNQRDSENYIMIKWED